MKYLFSFLLILVILSPKLAAQTLDTAGIVTLETKKQLFYVGELINITIDSVFINHSKLGSLAFKKSDIKNIHNGYLPPYFNETTNSSVPYYVQTALPNGRGNHYYKNYYIFGNEFNFGLSDHLNVTFGFETATIVFESGNSFPLIQLGTKYSASVSEKLHVGITAKYYFNEEGSALLLGSPLTFGGKRTNFTISPNYIYVEDSEAFGLFMNLSLATSAKVRLVVDIVRVEGVGATSIVFEYLFNSGFSLSLGGMTTDGELLPNLSFSIPFGRWKIN